MIRLAFLIEPYARNFVGLWHSRLGLVAAAILLIPAGIFMMMRQLGHGPPELIATLLVVAIACCATVLLDIVQATTRHFVGRKSQRSESP